MSGNVILFKHPRRDQNLLIIFVSCFPTVEYAFEPAAIIHFPAPSQLLLPTRVPLVQIISASSLLEQRRLVRYPFTPTLPVVTWLMWRLVMNDCRLLVTTCVVTMTYLRPEQSTPAEQRTSKLEMKQLGGLQSRLVEEERLPQ
jgi:hypothetical protein